MLPGLFFFLAGMVAGTILSGYARRLSGKPFTLSTLWPLFACPQCRAPLDFFKGFFSFLLSPIYKGPCPHCRQEVLEPSALPAALLTGALFLLTYLYTDRYFDLIKLLILFCLLILVTLIDLKSHIIPNPLVLAILVWGIFWQILHPPISWPEAILGLLLGGGFLLLTAVVSRGGMGGGDIKLMLAAGFYLGPALTALALFIAVLTGAAAGLILLILRIKKRKDPIAFGPFLCFGIASALLFGTRIISLYMGTVHL